eukprot:TRINITY_DN3030_c1_g1_i1.p1 TRINITY_DN3030_c1_g1~~TRINITY_DN3030_c1_g1_i1.p1  ORF type:complete len:434 (+),score=85.44 TRINITY_DN3030_c1_g1_i1:78-1379(+)
MAQGGAHAAPRGAGRQPVPPLQLEAADLLRKAKIRLRPGEEDLKKHINDWLKRHTATQAAAETQEPSPQPTTQPAADAPGAPARGPAPAALPPPALAEAAPPAGAAAAAPPPAAAAAAPLPEVAARGQRVRVFAPTAPRRPVAAQAERGAHVAPRPPAPPAAAAAATPAPPPSPPQPPQPQPAVEPEPVRLRPAPQQGEQCIDDAHPDEQCLLCGCLAQLETCQLARSRAQKLLPGCDGAQLTELLRLAKHHACGTPREEEEALLVAATGNARGTRRVYHRRCAELMHLLSAQDGHSKRPRLYALKDWQSVKVAERLDPDLGGRNCVLCGDPGACADCVHSECAELSAHAPCVLLLAVAADRGLALPAGAPRVVVDLSCRLALRADIQCATHLATVECPCGGKDPSHRAGGTGFATHLEWDRLVYPKRRRPQE